MSLHHGLVFEALIFLATAVVVSPLCHRLRVSPVLGYLVAGSIIGPVGWGLIADTDGTRSLAELGIVFLLFMIGLELSWERLKVIRHFIFGLGSAQLLITGGLAALAVGASGLSGRGALVVGLALAFSSTAFVLQILSERGGMANQTGRMAVAVLILQDLAVVPLLVMIPLLASNGSGSTIAWSAVVALVKAAIAMGMIFLVARVALRPFFQTVAATRSPEVFVAAALFAVIGTSVATESAGLSHSLGAFLAGLLLASTEFRHQIEVDLQPIRGLLMGLFFLTVGMTIDPAALLTHLPATAAAVSALVAGKALVIVLISLAFRFPLATAMHLGLLLAQGGEFAFIVLTRASQSGLIPGATAEALTAIVAISMAATPVLAALGEWVARRHRLNKAHAVQPDEAVDLVNHVIIAGCGRAGQIVASVLKGQNIAYVAIDRDPQMVELLRNKGEPVYFGDMRKPEVLKAVGAERARAVVLTIDSGSSREKLVPHLRQMFPSLHILVRARDRRQAKGLIAAGATAVVPELLEASLHLAGHALRHAGLPHEEVLAVLEDCRHEDYAKLALTHEKELI